MIKRLLVLGLVIFCFLSVNAQNKPFKLGFKASPAIHWASANDSGLENNGAKIGFTWGVISDITLLSNYYLHTGINYNYTNFALKFPVQVPDLTIGELQRTYKLQYVEVPIALKLRTNEMQNGLHFYGMVGFNTAFCVKARGKDKVYDASGDLMDDLSDDKNNISDQVSLIKESLMVGAGIEVMLDESLAVVIGLTYNNGLNDILVETSDLISPSDLSATASYVELSLSVLF